MITRRWALSAGFAALFAGPAVAQSLGLSAISPTDAERALREALTRGAGAAVSRLGRRDGFWADGAVRIPLPRALDQARGALAIVGASGTLDELHLQLNRAAETAVPRARTILTDAVKTMTIDDALGILRGGDTSATEYLRRAAGPAIGAEFRPPVSAALERVGAVRSADRLAQRYPFATSLLGASPRDALTTHTVDYGLNGLFYYVGQEERAIRQNPAKRVSAILRSVFGAL